MRVRSPGSSANLGPGFDVLGLAVTRYVWAADEGDGEPCGPEHIARIAYEKAGGHGPIWFDFELEPSRGLGFSAAARAAGAYLAYRQAGLDHERAQDAAYLIVADIEGHGDNAAPAVFGGIHVIAGATRHRLDARVPGRLLFWVPDLQTLTDDSRACLPGTVDRADAVFNLGRVGLLVAAFYEQRMDLLAEATRDRLHQPARLLACEASGQAYQTMLDHGAAAAWLSGSGPTIAAIAAEDRIGPITEALGSTGAVLQLPLDELGAVPEPA